MRRSLQTKFIFSYLTVALFTVLVVSVLIRLMSNQSLLNLVSEQQTAQLKEMVQDYYTANGSLEGFFDYYILASHKPPPAQSEPRSTPAPKPQSEVRKLRGVFGLIDADYRVIWPMPGYEIGQIVPTDFVREKIAVEVEGQIIAWILPDNNFQFKLSPEEEMFLKRSTLAIAAAAVAGVLTAVVMGIFLAGRLLKPIRLLTHASQALARGELNQQVPVTSQDELGQLTATFNQMSTDLARVDEQRKRLTADITHDLSTPLQIIAGYIEMLEGGDVPLTPQRLEIIKTEVEHLRRLVGDLTTLTQVEAGGLDIQLQPASPAALLARVYHAYQPIAARQEVELRLDASEVLPEIVVDEGRVVQVLKNLLENALRYTPAQGHIKLSAGLEGQSLHLSVTDTGAGIAAEDLPYVFDRFYRADKARDANTQGTKAGNLGLGLAICKALVAAQGGMITAESAGVGQGTTMRIAFPTNK